ncbi:hypothetical protein DFH29DRAFT_880939 [Suillus ampliporus]|nr:hypothetical protein DFH29DRAFT_880939 [Suillus ampliporus]
MHRGKHVIGRRLLACVEQHIFNLGCLYYTDYVTEWAPRGTLLKEGKRGQGQMLKKRNEKEKGKESAPKQAPPRNLIPPKAKSAEPTPTPKYKQNQPSMKERAKSQDRGWDSEDIVMDNVKEVKKNGNNNRSKENAYKLNSNSDQRNATCQRVLDISAKVKPEKILESVLRTPIRLEVGELLGTSHELSGILANTIKPKPLSNEPKIEAHSVWTKTCGLLIKIAMHCDGQAINAIIDTGSQLNIVNKHIWKTIINRPIDIAKSVSMNDANAAKANYADLCKMYR